MGAACFGWVWLSSYLRLPSRGHCSSGYAISITPTSAAPAAQVLNAVTRKLPFFVSQSEAEAEPPREELRLRHRVLDLRWAQRLLS